MEIIIFILFASLKSGLALRCFQCKGNDAAVCERSQRSSECPQYGEQPICLTISYEEKIDEKDLVMVKKRCSTNKFGCDGHCSRLWSNCKAECCMTDDCNEQRFKHGTTTWIGSKRSISDGQPTNNSTSRNSRSFLLIIASLIYSIISS